MVEANTEDFRTLISKGLVIVDFYAPWCGLCKILDRELNQLEVNVIKLNIEENRSVSDQFDIRTVPTLILFKDGVPLKKVTGYMPKQLIQKWMKMD